MKKLGRNDACWCGQRKKKYKHCHEALDERLMAESDKGHIVPTRDLLKTPEQIEKFRESCAVNIAVLGLCCGTYRGGDNNGRDR